MSKKKGNAKSGVDTRVSDDRKLGVTKKSSDFRWATREDPTIDRTKAEKLSKKEQKKQVNIEKAPVAETWLEKLRNNVNRRKKEARKAFLEKLTNKVELEKSLDPVFSTHFQWPRAYDMYAIATAMSAIALCYIISAIVSAFTDGLGSFGVNMWIGIIALIDAIGLWKIQLPFRKIKSKDVKAFKGYLAVQKILNVISFVVCEILAAVLLIASIALMVISDGLSDIVNSGAFDIGEATGGHIVFNADAITSFLDIAIAPTLFFLLAIFISVISAIVFTYYNRALQRFIGYIDELTASVESGIYRIENEPPYTSFMVFGTLSVIGGLLPIYILLWSGLSVVLFSPAIIFGVFPGIMFGEYLIFTAHLFRKIHIDAKSFSAMLDGTAAHELIERCDPEMLYRNGVNAEIDRLVAEGALTSQFASRIRREEIETFRNSQLFADMREAKELHREYSIESETGTSIIDCIIVNENGDIKIVDFKTDRQPEEQFIEEYSSQLSRYKSAVLQNFGKSPASMEVYSFYLGKSIPIQINE